MTYARMGWAFLLTALLCVPSFALAGQKIDLRQSDGTITELGGDGSAANVKCVSGCGGGGSGDASEAEQQAQTAILTTIDADTGTIAGAVKAEDAAHSSGHTGIPFWGVRNDSASTNLTDTNGDYTPIATDSNGRLFINAISSIFSVTPGTSATALGKAEDAAHTTGDSGVMLLGVRAASPTDRSAGPTDGDYEPLGINEAGAVWTTPTPTTAGGLSIFRSLDLDETEEDIKTSAGQMYGYYFANLSAGVRYLKFYNATAANVTVGTTTPVLTFPVAAGASGHVEYSHGIAFATAISAAVTTGVADNDTGAPGANDFVLNVFYK